LRWPGSRPAAVMARIIDWAETQFR